MEIKVPLTKEKAIRNHRRLWHWLADNPLQKKSDWPGWQEEGFHARRFCFLCQYRVENSFKCCSLDWGEHACFHKDSIYERYMGTSNPEERTRLARMIATLKEAKDDQYIY